MFVIISCTSLLQKEIFFRIFSGTALLQKGATVWDIFLAQACYKRKLHFRVICSTDLLQKSKVWSIF